MELVEERHRPGLGTAVQMAYSVGFMLLPLVGYFIRTEFWYQIVATSGIFFLPIAVLYAISTCCFLSLTG